MGSTLSILRTFSLSPSIDQRFVEPSIKSVKRETDTTKRSTDGSVVVEKSGPGSGHDTEGTPKGTWEGGWFVSMNVKQEDRSVGNTRVSHT